jgi:hypothetical protein
MQRWWPGGGWTIPTYSTGTYLLISGHVCDCLEIMVNTCPKIIPVLLSQTKILSKDPNEYSLTRWLRSMILQPGPPKRQPAHPKFLKTGKHEPDNSCASFILLFETEAGSYIICLKKNVVSDKDGWLDLQPTNQPTGRLDL